MKKFKFQPKTEVYISNQESHCFKLDSEGVLNKGRFKYKGTVTSTHWLSEDLGLPKNKKTYFL